MGGRKRKGVPVGGRGVPLQFSLSLTPLHTRAQEDFLLRCTANNSRITVGKHNWDLKQEGWTDGESHYACTSHTHAHTHSHNESTFTQMHSVSPKPNLVTHNDLLLTPSLGALSLIASIYLESVYVCVSVCLLPVCSVQRAGYKGTF